MTYKSVDHMARVISDQAQQIERLNHAIYALKEQLQRDAEDITLMMLELNILRMYASPEVSLKIQEARAALQPKENTK